MYAWTQLFWNGVDKKSETNFDLVAYLLTLCDSYGMNNPEVKWMHLKRMMSSFLCFVLAKFFVRTDMPYRDIIHCEVNNLLGIWNDIWPNLFILRKPSISSQEHQAKIRQTIPTSGRITSTSATSMNYLYCIRENDISPIIPSV